MADASAGPVTYSLESAHNVTFSTLGQSSYDASHVCHFFWSKTASVAYAEEYEDEASAEDVFFCGEGNPMTVDGQSSLYALSNAEWAYLLSSTDDGGRGDGDSKFKADVTVNGTEFCLVIAPDDYSGTITDLYDAAGWAVAESKGLVCLPAAGWRNGLTLEDVTSGCYWSATPNADKEAYYLDFVEGDVTPSTSLGSRTL